MPSLKDRFERLYAQSRPLGLIPVFFQQRKITNGSYLHDMLALHKSLFLCQSCRRKLWPGRFNYIELKMYHGEGICDGCQVDGPAALWLWEGSEQWAERTRAASCEAVRRREIQMGQRIA